MSRPIIRPINKSDWRQYRDTRLKALKDSPQAFGSTYENTSKLPDSEWLDRLTRITLDRDLPLAAVIESQFVGMAWARIEEPNLEVVHLYQMWVSPSFRGHRIGYRLLETALAWAGEQGAKTMILGVTYGDTPARKLYESAGFRTTNSSDLLRPGSDLRVQTMKYDLPVTGA
jgi:ribosomal protein S18 acetylase RimI-like enzyme